MEPKFQSSFIPKNSSPGAPAPIGGNSNARRVSNTNFISFSSRLLFTLSVLLALAVFGYKYYLSYNITQMDQELVQARSAIAPDTIHQIIDLDKRISSTNSLISNHRIISPVFTFLQQSTPKTVRYTDFGFEATDKGLVLTLKGQAQGYAALSQAADLLNKSNYFKGSYFSDLTLDDKGNVVFTVTTNVDQSLLSYEAMVDKMGNIQAQTLPVTTVQGSTTTQSVASSTKP